MMSLWFVTSVWSAGVDVSERGWSVRDLAESAGTTVRTIHYYISEGLLPSPDGATRSATYSTAHLARLRLIAALRDEGLALANIRQRLAPLTDEQALEVATELDEYLALNGGTPLSTLGLIEAALASRNVAESEETAMPRLRSLERPPIAEPRLSFPSESTDSTPDGTAGDYLSRVRRQPGSQPPPPVSMPRPKPPVRRPIDSERPEAWYSFQIEDGVELRVREDRYRESKGRLRAVIDTLRTTMRRYGVSPSEPQEE